jgi:hypothetical protein
LQTAILFLVFNRPYTTRQVLATIRQARPARLYIAADGPRADRPSEKKLCEEVRRIATTVDWPCDIQTLFREENLGCRRSVSGALDWFFEQEESGVILEDDCVPDQSLFPFTEELLDRYRDDKRIMNICGTNLNPDVRTPLRSYFFSRYNNSCGWASWSRAWRHYDHDMSLWPSLRNTDWLFSIGNGSELFRRYWTRIFDMCHAGKVDSWAWRWKFSCWAQNGLAILPAKNLVTNIGFGDDATHTKSGNGILDNLPLQKMAFPLIHPNYMVLDLVADRWIGRYDYGIRLKNEIMIMLLQLPGAKLTAKTLRTLKFRK